MDQSEPTTDDWLTIEEAADEYGVPPSTLRRWCVNLMHEPGGSYNARKRGKMWFINPEWLAVTMTPVRRYKPVVALRRQIKSLIQAYSSNNNPSILRAAVIKDLEALLDG